MEVLLGDRTWLALALIFAGIPRPASLLVTEWYLVLRLGWAGFTRLVGMRETDKMYTALSLGHFGRLVALEGMVWLDIVLK